MTTHVKKAFDIDPSEIERHEDLRRLSDIAVEEVSLVDRGANKRRLVVVKRRSDMANRVAKKDGESPEVKIADLLKAMEDGASQIRALLDGDLNAEKPADFEKRCQDLAKALGEVSGASSVADAATEPETPVSDAAAPAAAPVTNADPALADASILRLAVYALETAFDVVSMVRYVVDDANSWSLKWCLEAFNAKVGEMSDTAKQQEAAAVTALQGVVQRSATLSAGKAIDNMTKTLERLSKRDPQFAAVKAVVAKRAAVVDAPAAEPAPVAKTETPAVPTPVPAAEPEPATPAASVAKVDPPAAVPAPAAPPSGEVAALTKQLGDLLATVQAQQAQLSQIAKSTGLPNSVPSGEQPVVKAARDESWPLDLNAPVDRETVKARKRESFHGD